MLKTFVRIMSLLLVASFFFVSPAVHAQALTQLSANDIVQINTILDTIQTGVRTAGVDGVDAIKSTLAPDARNGLEDDIFFGVPFSGQTVSFSLDNPTQVATDGADSSHVKFTAALSVHTKDPDYQGTATPYFIFSKEGGQWYLLDTDFYKYLGSTFSDSATSNTSDNSNTSSTSSSTVPATINSSAGGYAVAFSVGLIVFVFVLGLLFFIFWLWMLIAVIRRPSFPNKVIWVIVIIFLQVLGALIYYFAEHRAYKKSLKQVEESSYPASTPPPTVPPTPSV